MEENYLNRNLVCILFPGVVRNDEKALQCLGGIRGISQAYSQPTKKRLTLNYQPDNQYMKKLYADSKTAAGVVLKIKVKKTKIGSETDRKVISTTVLGRVNKIYKFESMFDFQYLPVSSEGSSQPRCILEEILPSGTDTVSILLEPSPLFVVPSHFTRPDKHIRYSYTDKRYPERKVDSPELAEIVHKKLRNERGVPTNRFPFNLVDELLSEPPEYFIKTKNARIAYWSQLEQEYETVKKLFDERPIWSFNLIRYTTRIRQVSLKVILPCLAIYFKSGPWRMLWIRYGYDPRKEPEAGKYQCLDFRVRHTAGVHSMVKTRGHVAVHKPRPEPRRRHRPPRDEPSPSDEVSEGAVIFRPGMVPTQRQIFYQYCDVKLPEVEELVARQGSHVCHMKRGWLPPNADHICRDHIFRYAKESLLATYNTDMKFEQGGSSDDSNSDNDTNEGEDAS